MWHRYREKTESLHWKINTMSGNVELLVFFCYYVFIKKAEGEFLEWKTKKKN